MYVVSFAPNGYGTTQLHIEALCTIWNYVRFVLVTKITSTNIHIAQKPKTNYTFAYSTHTTAEQHELCLIILLHKILKFIVKRRGVKCHVNIIHALPKFCCSNYKFAFAHQPL